MQESARGVKGIIVKDEKFLILVKHNGRLDLPGGRIERGESFEDSLVRVKNEIE